MRACARSAIRKRSSSGATSLATPSAEPDVAPSDVEMREERVLLEEVADPPMLGRDVDPALRVQEQRDRRV